MKQLFFIALAAIALSSCDKSQAIAVTPETKQPQEKPTTSPIIGAWHYRDFEYRTFTIDSVVNQSAYITFGFTIDAPNNKTVRLVYDLQQKGDTLFCTTTTIYPCMFFTSNQTVGWGIEYANIPQKGTYLPLARAL